MRVPPRAASTSSSTTITTTSTTRGGGRSCPLDLVSYHLTTTVVEHSVAHRQGLGSRVFQLGGGPALLVAVIHVYGSV